MYHIKNDQPAIRVSQMLYDALVVLIDGLIKVRGGI